ncbi:MAG: hypothetical protein SPL05_03955 [Eubacteriales bacterium]|nr:hypothetical protein [Eubacteriales bacterium]
MQKQKTVAYAALCALVILALLYMYIGQFSHPFADDFSFAIGTRNAWKQSHSISAVLSESFAQVVQSYQDWQGSFLAVFLFTLNPIVFAYTLYPLSSILLIVLFVSSNFVLCYTLLHVPCKQSKLKSLALAAAVVFIQLLLLPSPYEYFYNYISGCYYTVFQSLALFAFAYIARISKLSKVAYCILPLLFFIIGAGNYITAVFCITILAMLLGLVLIKKQKQRPVLYLLCIVALCTSLLISALAPGNAQRQSLLAEGLPLHPVKAIALSALASMKIGAHMFDFKLLLVVFVFFYLGDFPKISPIVLLVASFLLTTAQFTPIFYAQGNAGPDRIYTLIYCNTFILFCFNVWNCMQHIRHKLKAMYLIPLCVLSIAITILLPPASNLYNIYADIRHGHIQNYHSQKMQRHLQMEQANADAEVYLAPITVNPHTLETGDFDVQHNWINIAYEKYYNIAYVHNKEK